MNGRPVEGFVAGQKDLFIPKLMLAGEAPRENRDWIRMFLFSGQAGKELMQALSSTGLTREECVHYHQCCKETAPYRVTHRINKRTQQSENCLVQIRTPTVPKYLRMQSQYWITRTDEGPAKINLRHLETFYCWSSTRFTWQRI